MFVTGDLVYFLGYSYIRDHDMLGVVTALKYDLDNRHDPLYEVFWVKQGYKALHSGMQIELVYVCDRDNGDIVKINVS